MRIAGTISRYLLALIFVVFGSNGFLHFLPMLPMAGLAGQFLGAVVGSGYYLVIFALQLIPGIMLLANRYVPLALTLLAPVIVNIFFFHVFMAPSGLPLAVLVVVLWILAALNVRSAFAGILQARTD